MTDHMSDFVENRVVVRVHHRDERLDAVDGRTVPARHDPTEYRATDRQARPSSRTIQNRHEVRLGARRRTAQAASVFEKELHHAFVFSFCVGAATSGGTIITKTGHCD